MKKYYESNLEMLLDNIEGVTDVKPYSLVNNWGCTFMKNDKHYDVRRWVNCYGVDLGYQLFGTKAEEDTHHFTPSKDLDVVLKQVKEMI